MSKIIRTKLVNGRQVIGTGALIFYDTNYHRPYLAKLTETGKLDWQEKEYLYHGEQCSIYSVIEQLQPGDLIQAAGGSRSNEYLFKGRVIDVGNNFIELEEIDDQEWSNLLDQEWSNLLAARKNIHVGQRHRAEAQQLLARTIEIVGHEQALQMLQEMDT